MLGFRTQNLEFCAAGVFPHGFLAVTTAAEHAVVGHVIFATIGKRHPVIDCPVRRQHVAAYPAAVVLRVQQNTRNKPIDATVTSAFHGCKPYARALAIHGSSFSVSCDFGEKIEQWSNATNVARFALRHDGATQPRLHFAGGGDAQKRGRFSRSFPHCFPRSFPHRFPHAVVASSRKSCRRTTTRTSRIPIRSAQLIIRRPTVRRPMDQAILIMNHDINPR